MRLPHPDIIIPEVQANFEALEEFLDDSTLTSFPANPYDGQLVYFQNTTMKERGIVWHFRYNAKSTSAHKWEFVGGSPLSTGVEGAREPTTPATTFQPIPVGSTPVVCPLAGVYVVIAGYGCHYPGVSSVVLYSTAVRLSEPEVPLIGLNHSYIQLNSSSIIYGTLRTPGIEVEVEAGTVLEPGLASNLASQTIGLSASDISIQPVRVG